MNDTKEVFEQAAENSELIKSLDQVLVDSQVFRQKAHTYHWNVRGPLFHSLHDFFGDIYEEMEVAVDEIAERVRTLGAFPTSDLSAYPEQTNLSNPEPESDVEVGRMISNLLTNNQELVDTLVVAENVAKEVGNEAVLDFVVGRHDQHSIYHYKLSAHSHHG